MKKTNINFNTLTTNKKFYETAFIATTLSSFFIWLFLIFLGGEASSQFSIFFRECEDFLADTLNVVGYSSLRDVYRNIMYTGLAEKAYPPLTYVIMYMFSRLVDMTPYYQANYFLYMYIEPKFLIIFIICLSITIVILYESIRYYKDGRQLVKILTAFSILLSAPVLFSIERANTIIATLILVIFYIFNYDNDNKILKELALICLATATAFKITPPVLGIFLLYNKQWKDAIRAVIYGLLIGFIPFLFFEGGLRNYYNMKFNIQLQLATYSSEEGCTFLASIIGLGIEPGEVFYTIIKYSTYVISVLLFVFAPMYKSKWETILAVTMVLIILPSHSAYYCILYIIPAIIAFLNEEKHYSTDLIILFSFLIIMFDVQGLAREYFLNYHLSILIIVFYLLAKGFYMCYSLIKNKNMRVVSNPVQN